MENLSDYDYLLPPELIAAEPAPRRDSSRVLVVDRPSGGLAHAHIGDLPKLLQPGDCLVMNDTRVVPARLFGSRRKTGGKWEGLFLRTRPSGEWLCLCQVGGKLRAGEIIEIDPAHHPDSAERLILELRDRDDEGIWTVIPASERPALELLQQFGTVPLPPYIHRKLGTEIDWDRYQTTYASRPGAVAAPTAGLHFTPELLAACDSRGISRAFVTLHVGIGTFRPISVEHLGRHVMHHEWCEITAETCEQLEHTRANGGRIVAVGTTSVRTLETAARSGRLTAFSGETDLFIRPPYEFRAVDCLLTNFHLPRSTLLVLVSAFAGFDLTRQAYASAVEAAYRFYSYGDAMLIL